MQEQDDPFFEAGPAGQYLRPAGRQQKKSKKK
jgi:hypothetical protein